ncbi:MAG: XRE family transcriptional regulator [Chloroflexi bacterium]|nr:MAG: XRE family transcriptional regulator [Chloroflexota bacterium]
MPESTVVEQKAALRRKILGVKIRHARIRAGLNMKEVGQALGVSSDLISEIEYGRRDVSLPQLEVMALIFNVPVIYFWSDDVISEPNLEFPAQQAMALRQRIIGVLLRQARTGAGHTQETLGNLLNVPASRIARYEYGKTEIPLPHLEALSEYLNVPLSYFLDQGINPNGNGQVTSLDDLANYSHLPGEVKAFLSNPANLLYINIAMKLSELSADTLRALAEGLLEVTY